MGWHKLRIYAGDGMGMLMCIETASAHPQLQLILCPTSAWHYTIRNCSATASKKYQDRLLLDQLYLIFTFLPDRAVFLI